jgi:adenosylcobinamide-GDP ribazoletransferase
MPERSEVKPSIPVVTPFIMAFQFLTTFPPIIRRSVRDEELGRAVGYFPLVGLLIGGILVGSSAFFRVLLPTSLVTVLTLVVWVLTTGALHIDGFLDSLDGLFGGNTPEQRMEIMQDERVGAFGMAGGVILILTKYIALASILSVQSLILAPVIGRWAVSLVLVSYPYGREKGLGRTMKDYATWRQVILATLITVVIVWFTADWQGLEALILILLLAVWVGWFTMNRIPGLTGDIYGALCELSEVVVLVFLAAGAG